ncbi:MAG: DUF2851 family protein [Calditrichaceae bacterium]
MQETELYQYWQYYARKGSSFEMQGHTLQILNQGQFNFTRGPDVRGAMFNLDGVIYHGDVEFHVLPADWYRHQHHLDRAFQNVILHLVGDDPGSESRKISHGLDGRLIPTFILPKPETSFFQTHPANHCRESASFRTGLKEKLERLALERLNIKVRQFTHLLNYQSPESILYRYIFRALGYPHNAAAFEQLAERLEWPWMLWWTENISDDPKTLYSVYAGHASFLSEKSPDPVITEMLNIYKNAKIYLKSAPIDPGQWQFASTRPANHPHFRLAAWVWLLNQNHFESPQSVFMEILGSRQKYRPAYRKILDYFKVRVNPYWLEHSALGRERTGVIPVYFFGEARISEFIVNVLLPLYIAMAAREGSDGFQTYLESFYLWLPLPVSYRTLRQKFSFYSDCIKVWNGQGMQQALLHLQSGFCLFRECNRCPLKRKND